jgi:hypothetical protein
LNTSLRGKRPRRGNDGLHPGVNRKVLLLHPCSSRGASMVTASSSARVSLPERRPRRGKVDVSLVRRYARDHAAERCAARHPPRGVVNLFDGT